MNQAKRKRVTVKPKKPNPLFEQWLTEWRDKARENESKMQFCFSVALRSLQKYPLPLETGKDCKILNGFGEKLCKMLDDKLMQHKTENEPKRKAQKSPFREYVPQLRSGAYAILVTLHEKSLEPNYPGFMTKSEIISNGQHLSNTSFTKPLPDTRYTAWSSMATLLQKNLVNKEGNPARFSLTEEGGALADKLYIQQKIEEFQQESSPKKKKGPICKGAPAVSASEEGGALADKLYIQQEFQQESSPKKKKGPICKGAPAASTSSSQSSCSTFESVLLAPHSFEILLLVDKQELNGGKNPDADPLLVELKTLQVPHEVRNLKVGDYLWICRDTSTNTELVLPYIIERKRMDDLGHSIKDDRFHEQKFRLKQCGLQNLIYLIEHYGKNERVGLPLSTLMQAATNTLVQDEFTVKFTEDGRATCKYLACMTKFLTKIFESKTLASCQKEDLQDLDLDDDLTTLMHFKDFNKSSSKTKRFKIRDMFIKQLLQIKGMSVDKALAIVEKYPAPRLLKSAYDEVGGEPQGEKLLATIRYGPLNKNVGPVLSKIVYQLFCKEHYS